ncbi:ubiquitin carboxyl-terminal hydrolase 20 [Diachasma alloeum]|uniref:ubiquitin carboxyl-terminal hydrolase 20 n=1 Tax=Diachasma alloeum TaxID=454923 RepID=UPI0007384604|nr:ubiquitin carboxyl-terminal hydrolase 20 [Diachasma alloeum]XP_015122299.1 ubiquitin carboxyl-terminal hydrolase 20 [Diachasma alloeum]XP_015122300.1 ubiquitin carboxyl-terminal hydrolase 20 [Diachasma alloeum]
MPIVARNCPHILNHGDLRIIEGVFCQKERFIKCSDCDNEGPDLWLCLYPDCRWVGCTETHLDHSTLHNNKHPMHCAHMNLSTNRIWCYMCEREVITRHIPSPPSSPTQMDVKAGGNRFIGDGPGGINYKAETDSFGILLDRFYTNYDAKFNSERTGDSPDSTDSEESRDFGGKPRGLVGLQNIGNTCYMNSALQALSNVVPLTQYFLDCGQAVSHIVKDRKPGLSLNYMNLVKDMWNRKTRGYVVPNGILSGIRAVNPMFRGYHQHDTQEFLRCFMDQLHEELKERVEEDREQHVYLKLTESSDEEDPEMDGTTSSQSDAEYETCDSGVSEQSSTSDDGDRGTKRRYSRVSQSEKFRNKFTTRSLKKPLDDQYNQPQRSLQNSPTKHRAKKQMKTRSIISDIFDGKLLSSVQCLMCDRVSTRVETFQDLSLPIPSRDHIDMLHQGSLTPQKAGPCSDVVYVTNQSGWISWFFQWMRSWFWGPVVSLHDCLSAFFSADELKGDNMYSCEKCNKLRNGIKFSKVLDLPEILCIHLKRFRHELMFSSKIANYVSFPLDGLDMRPYLHKDCVSKVTTYDLISVICHHGTAGGGHYTCYALNSDINQWFEFDDQCVTQVSPETVKNCEAYVLFYKKSSHEMAQCRDKIVELLETSSREPELNFYVSKAWINRFNTCSEPGMIDNSDFLCPHGGVNPVKVHYIDKLSRPLPQAVWEHLYNTFGGGPACTHLFECPVCVEKYETLQKRRKYELEVFQRFNNMENPTAIYALAMVWLRQWQSFVKGKETQPPGPIDNSSIVVTVNGQKVLKPGSDCSQVSEEVWQFFLNIYGGGPELMLQPCQRPQTLQPNISLHSTSAPNLMDQSPKPNRIDVNTNKVTITKSTETISQQDSAIESIASDSDSMKSQRDSSG